MPSEKKKKQPPPIYTPTPRRLLQSLTIHDLTQGRIICMPSSLSPSPSVSRMCICDQEENAQPVCCHLKDNQDDIRHGQKQEQQKPNESPAGKDGVTADSLPCCRDILRKLAQEVLAFSDTQLDKPVCMRDKKSEATPPCCISSKPVTSLPECSIKTCPISKSSINAGSKKDFCCDVPDCQDTEIFEEPTRPIRGNQPVTSLPECSIKTCPISKPSVKAGSKKDFCCDVQDFQDTEIFEVPTRPIRGNQPVTSLPECSIKRCPISKSSVNAGSKKDFCCDVQDCQDTEIFEEPTRPIWGNDIKSTPQEKPVVPKEELCSITSCAREFSIKSKSSKWTDPDSGDSKTQLHTQSESAANDTPKLRAMPPSTPTPSRKGSTTIGKNSSMKLLGGTSNSDVKQEKEETKGKKSSFKLFGRSSKSKVKNEDDKEENKKSKSKEEKKNSNKKKDDKTASVTETCSNMRCKTKTCTCRFPPAYNQYYDCTGQISGTCHCERDNFPNV